MKRIILAALVGVMVSGSVWGETVKFEDLAAPLDRDGRPPE